MLSGVPARFSEKLLADIVVETSLAGIELSLIGNDIRLLFETSLLGRLVGVRNRLTAESNRSLIR